MAQEEEGFLDTATGYLRSAQDAAVKAAEAAKVKLDSLLESDKESVTSKVREKGKSLTFEKIATLERHEDGSIKDKAALETVLMDFLVKVSQKNTILKLDSWVDFLRTCPDEYKASFANIDSEIAQNEILSILKKDQTELEKVQNESPEAVEEQLAVLGSGFETILKAAGAIGVAGIAWYGVKSLYSKFFKGDGDEEVETKAPIASAILLATATGAYLGRDKLNDILSDHNVDLTNENIATIGHLLKDGEFRKAFDALTNEDWTKAMQLISKREKLDKNILLNFARVPVRAILKEHDSLKTDAGSLVGDAMKSGLESLNVDVNSRLYGLLVSNVVGENIALTDAKALVEYIRRSEGLYDAKKEPNLTLKELVERDFSARAPSH